VFNLSRNIHEMSLSPLTAIVTGASSGIGTAIAKSLLLEGYRIAAVGRDIKRLKEAFSDQTDDNVKFIIADLATLEGCSFCISASLSALETSSLNLLVNNAGGGVMSQQWGSGFNVEAFDSVFALNVRAPALLLNAAVPALIEARGVCVNLSSVAGQRPFNGLGAYCMSKAAIDMFTQSAALELASKGVRVVGVAPGTVSTNFHVKAGMSSETAAEYYKASALTHPIGRVGQAEDIANAVMFLISPKASFITGTTLVVDGGRLLTSSTAPQLSASK